MKGKEFTERESITGRTDDTACLSCSPIYMAHIYVIPQDSPMVVKGVTANDSRQETGAGEKQACKEAKEVKELRLNVLFWLVPAPGRIFIDSLMAESSKVGISTS